MRLHGADDGGADRVDGPLHVVHLTDEDRCLLAHADALLDRRHAAQTDLDVPEVGAAALRLG